MNPTSFALQVEETTTNDKSVIDDHHHGTHNDTITRLHIIFGMNVSLESRHNKIGEVKLDSPQNDAVNKMKMKLLHCKVIEMEAECSRTFLYLSRE